MSLSSFLAALSQAATVIQSLAGAIFSGLVGIWLMYSGVVRLATWGDARRQYGISSVLMRFAVGSLLINYATTLNMVVLTFTGQSGGMSSNSMSVMPSSSSGGVAGTVIQVALLWCATFGVVAIGRGLLLFVKASDNGGGGPSNQDPVWTGAVFCVSGAIGVNLWRFVS
jgi:hypothetical protein